MKKIKEYRLVVDERYVDVEDRVNDMIKQGWQPYGPPFCVPKENRTSYAQAMVLYEGEP